MIHWIICYHWMCFFLSTWLQSTIEQQYRTISNQNTKYLLQELSNKEGSIRLKSAIVTYLRNQSVFFPCTLSYHTVYIQCNRWVSRSFSYYFKWSSRFTKARHSDLNSFSVTNSEFCTLQSWVIWNYGIAPVYVAGIKTVQYRYLISISKYAKLKTSCQKL